MTPAGIVWRRLDMPGHDACRLRKDDAGWNLDGTAVFSREGVPARLTYRVACDAAWRTQQGYVHGWVGAESIELGVVRTAAGAWTLNGSVVSNLEACVDLDLGFTPATNLIAIRRLDLAVGQAADAPAAWLDVFGAALGLLSQRYERRGATRYWYEAPGAGYTAMLEVAPTGFVRRYPGLWEAEP